MIIVTRLTLVVVIVYLSHVKFLSLLWGNENLFGNYAFAILTLAISYGGFQILNVYCFAYKINRDRNIYISVIENILLPSYFIYLLGIPFLGMSILSSSYLLSMLACIVLMLGLSEDIQKFFWKRKGKDTAHVLDSGEISREDMRRLESQAFFLLIVIPLAGRLISFAY